MRERILVVDDEPGMALGMQRTLERRGFDVDTAANGPEALELLETGRHGVMFTDLRMPGMGGDELMRRARTRDPALQVVLVTAFGTVESAVACVREGALDYLMKPFSPDSLLRAATLAVQSTAASQERIASIADPDSSSGIVAEDPAVLAAFDLARRAARSEATILLEAESGAGKEVFARFIHRESPRADGPFVAVNCAAMPRELLEAELFGHTRGAFTGAHRERKGQFQAADGGSLLLDEIGEMDVDLQARLLRVLQDHVVRPVGADLAVHTDVRVIAATNCNLREAVADGRFREDLYYRLRVMPLRIPPLRERPGDVTPLARRFGRSLGGPGSDPTAAALARLESHDWPGNVRELKNVIQRAVILAGGERIDVDHIMLESQLDVQRQASGDAVDTGEPADGMTLVDAEREAIRQVLVRTRGNRQEAARALGISPRTLRHKLKCFRDEGRPVPEPR